MADLVIRPQFIDLEHPTVLRALLRHIVEHADCVECDHKGRRMPRLGFGCEDWLLYKLAAVGAAHDDLKYDKSAEDEEISMPYRTHRLQYALLRARLCIESRWLTPTTSRLEQRRDLGYWYNSGSSLAGWHERKRGVVSD